MPRFAEQVEVAIEALSTNPPQPFEENEFIDASRLVYDGVRDIRKAVLMIRVGSSRTFTEFHPDILHSLPISHNSQYYDAFLSEPAIWALLPMCIVNPLTLSLVHLCYILGRLRDTNQLLRDTNPYRTIYLSFFLKSLNLPKDVFAYKL